MKWYNTLLADTLGYNSEKKIGCNGIMRLTAHGLGIQHEYGRQPLLDTPV